MKAFLVQDTNKNTASQCEKQEDERDNLGQSWDRDRQRSRKANVPDGRVQSWGAMGSHGGSVSRR